MASGIDRAVASAGDTASLAERLGVTRQAVCSWIKRGWVPHKRALEIEALYGVPRVDLLKPTLVPLVHGSPEA